MTKSENNLKIIANNQKIRDMEKFGERLDYMLRITNMGKTKLAEQLGIHRTSIHNMVTNRVTPRPATLDKIIFIFSEFNPVWITMGRGEMYRNGVHGESTELLQLRQAVKDKDELIVLLKEKIDRLTTT